MTNKSPLRHQSPGINSRTQTIDSDAFKAGGESLYMDTELGQAWRERTKIISQHGHVRRQCHNLYVHYGDFT